LDTLAIPQQFKESLWKKAEDLAEIVQAPGDDCAWMVRSCSNK